jgi:hypothetical protein
MKAEITSAELSRHGSRWKLMLRLIVIVGDIGKDYHKGRGS